LFSWLLPKISLFLRLHFCLWLNQTCLSVLQLEEKQNFYLHQNGVHWSTQGNQGIYDWTLGLYWHGWDYAFGNFVKCLEVSLIEVNFVDTFRETDNIKKLLRKIWCCIFMKFRCSKRSSDSTRGPQKRKNEQKGNGIIKTKHKWESRNFLLGKINLIVFFLPLICLWIHILQNESHWMWFVLPQKLFAAGPLYGEVALPRYHNNLTFYENCNTSQYIWKFIRITWTSIFADFYCYI
jgi:hypothetical protein